LVRLWLHLSTFQFAVFNLACGHRCALPQPDR
jgi:hypothetical protein